MIVFLGVVVGGIVISMYLPLFSLIGKWQATRTRAALARMRVRRLARAPADWEQGTCGCAGQVPRRAQESGTRQYGCRVRGSRLAR